jgi:hypothetical protein
MRSESRGGRGVWMRVCMVEKHNWSGGTVCIMSLLFSLFGMS